MANSKKISIKERNAVYRFLDSYKPKTWEEIQKEHRENVRNYWLYIMVTERYSKTAEGRRMIVNHLVVRCKKDG
jgi:hypothetical protein